MITLTLLHPSKSTPVQSWMFDSEPVVRLGRGHQNEVVLYSAVVSRRHAELRNTPTNWELVSFGANGTFVDGKPIKTMSIIDGMIVRLGESGPRIRISLSAVDPQNLGKVVKRQSSSSDSLSESLDTKGKQTLYTMRSSEKNNH